ncbi:DUF6252 family protein [Capnocytophaga sp.]|uniref:DUF6252 family protein n=1 Tax=Capnocytophaga sp. TaxID=44737 RepID=UPI0026DB9C13|nr:DUF6252 family protein [Capnocytophaga sp.]MDO5104785.1 DUF6252 family protein [Capnocytophaga sp.]
MKKTFYLSVFALLALIFSCSKNENSQNESYYFRATVNGTKVEASKHHVSVFEKTLRIFGVWGSNSTEGIAFSIQKFTSTTGSISINYPTENIENQAKYHKDYTSVDEHNHYGNTLGNLTITELTAKTIKGTFAFTAKNQKGDVVTVTDGEFFLPLGEMVLNIGAETQLDVVAKFKEIVPQNVLNDIQSRGFEIHQGANPPIIEGAFLSQPHVLMSPYAGDSRPKGYVWPNRTYTIYNQTVSTARLSVQASDASEKGTGVYVMGSGNRFTIFSQLEGAENGIKKKNITLLSGEVTQEGIKNLKAAYTLIWKDGDTSNSVLMPVGKSRISGDSDGLAARMK